MKQEEIKELIYKHFKTKDVGVGLLDCISEDKDVDELATELFNNLSQHIVSGLLPTIAEVSDKCEQDIKSFLNTNEEDEIKHYRVAHRRSFEFVVRHLDNNR